MMVIYVSKKARLCKYVRKIYSLYLRGNMSQTEITAISFRTSSAINIFV